VGIKTLENEKKKEEQHTKSIREYNMLCYYFFHALKAHNSSHLRDLPGFLLLPKAPALPPVGLSPSS